MCPVRMPVLGRNTVETVVLWETFGEDTILDGGGTDGGRHEEVEVGDDRDEAAAAAAAAAAAVMDRVSLPGVGEELVVTGLVATRDEVFPAVLEMIWLRSVSSSETISSSQYWALCI